MIGSINTIFLNKMLASFDIGEKNLAYVIGTSSEIIRWKRHDILKSKTQTIVESCEYISTIFSQEDWSQCSRVFIEQQMNKNVRAQRISQHVWTWFRLSCPKIIVKFIPSRLKTQFFLGKNTLSNKSRKTWAVEKVTEILMARNDLENLAFLVNNLKRDDLADSYLQLIAAESTKF